MQENSKPHKNRYLELDLLQQFFYYPKDPTDHLDEFLWRRRNSIIKTDQVYLNKKYNMNIFFEICLSMGDDKLKKGFMDATSFCLYNMFGDECGTSEVSFTFCIIITEEDL